MRTRKAILWLVFLVGMSALDCTAKVYVRWTQSKLPTAKVLGVNKIVIPWHEGATALLVEAKRQGYQAYLEVGAAQVADAMSAVGKTGITGVILHGDAAEHSALEEKAKELRASYPKLKILVIDPNGKQPDMRGWLVFKKDGILQVSSPTSQPWLDTNLAMIRHARAFEGARVPFYTFAWDENDPLVKKQGPKPVDYALAIAEAGAYHADLLLEVHEAQQKGLANGDKHALADWAQVKRYVDFYQQSSATEAEARVGVLTGDFETSYEALNLMARHNIAFRVLKSSEVKAADLSHFDVVIAFAELGRDLANAINEFATKGGVAVLVKLQGPPFAWESAGAGTTSGPSTTYTVEKGRVIELKEAMIDPETFAQDVRRLMTKANVPVSLWNSLTTLVAAYPGEKAAAMNVELVNYDEESSEVQVQVKGAFRSAEYETPEGGCCKKIKVVRFEGFTQFVVPDLLVGGRVRLE
jgi:protein-tyrosine-phosphatase